MKSVSKTEGKDQDIQVENMTLEETDNLGNRNFKKDKMPNVVKQIQQDL